MIERLELFINSLSISVRAFEISIGASNGLIRKAIANKTDINSKWISNIAEKYPQLSLGWLLTGKGKMCEQNEISPYEENHIETIVSEPGAVYEQVQDKYPEIISGGQLDILINIVDKLADNENNNNNNVAVMNENMKELIAQGREQTANITKLVNFICQNGTIPPGSVKKGDNQDEDNTQEESHDKAAAG